MTLGARACEARNAMAKDKPNLSEAGTRAQARRRERLAAALRANLARRKAAARGQESGVRRQEESRGERQNPKS